MEYFAKIVDCIQLLTSFAEHFILSVSQGYEYVSRKNKQKPDAMSFIPQKKSGLQSLQISSAFKFNFIFT